MKMNWGTGIVIGMALFMGFIITLVVKMTSSKVDLVAKDYYEQGIGYQKQIESIEAANALSAAVAVEVDYASKQLEITFPPDFEGKTITGTALMFYPANAKKDVSFPVSVGKDLKQTIALDNLVPGNWRVKLHWKCEGRDYYFEKVVVI